MNLKTIWEKKIVSLWNPSMKAYYDLRYNGGYVVITSVMCNLNCFSCSVRPNIKGNITSVASLDSFMDLIDGVFPEKWIILTGGEPTYNVRHLMNLVDVIKSYNRKIALLTNGYNADKINPFHFDLITLDDHITNQNRIREVSRFYNECGYKTYRKYVAYEHFDIQKVLDSGYVSLGKKCHNYAVPALYGNKMYSCCGLPTLERWVNEDLSNIMCDPRCWSGYREKQIKENFR